MRIRTLVPALACLAAAPVFLAAADAPAAAPLPVKLDGFIDTIYGWSDAKTDGASTGGPQTGFQYFAKLGAEMHHPAALGA